MRRLTLLTYVLPTLVLVSSSLAQVNPPVNVTLLKNLDRGDYSGNWGYTAPNGVELAISGTTLGTSFINATDPVNAVEIAFIPGPNSGWREMATYGQYCYIVTEGTGAALQIVSLVNPLSPTLVATLNPPSVTFSTAHEIKADPQTGFLYVCGTDDDLVILDATANPLLPRLRGIWRNSYAHDLSVKDGRAYVAAIFEPGVFVLDVSNPPANPPWSPPTIAQWTYPNAGTHNTWPTADNRYLVTTDETDGYTLRMWDIQNLPSVAQTDEFASSTGAIVHNAYVRGNLCYMAHYRDGFRIVDISDPNNIQSVGWYDTHPQNGQGYQGAWGAWCFAANPRIVYITDRTTGTYILRYDGPLTSGVDEPPAAPGATTALRGNFPNPFNPSTAIKFDLAASGPVSLRIFDAGGRLIRTLIDGPRAAGAQSAVWDGRSDGAAPVPSGVYFYRLEAPGFAASEQMVLTK